MENDVSTRSLYMTVQKVVGHKAKTCIYILIQVCNQSIKYKVE